MTKQTVLFLNALNTGFYEIVADSFSSTRQQPWVGWEKAWQHISSISRDKDTLRVLDLGCGNGRFADFCLQNFSGTLQYFGIDQNEKLLQEARRKYQSDDEHSFTFQQIDIISKFLQNQPLVAKDTLSFDLIVSFGVLHHIPSIELRQRFFQQVADLLTPEARAIVSCWQFDRNANLLERQVDPDSLGVNTTDLEPNDFFLTWERGEKAIRYCHLVNQEEQDKLIAGSGLHLVDRFSADGKSGQDNDYLIFF
jgi:tRNA (uracil-5-)-methyltransferase TRM9